MQERVVDEIISAIEPLTTPQQRWEKFVEQLRGQAIAFADASAVWNWLGQDQPTPFPVWFPSRNDRRTNLANFMGAAAWTLGTSCMPGLSTRRRTSGGQPSNG